MSNYPDMVISLLHYSWKLSMRYSPLILLFIYIYLEVSVFVMVADEIGVLLALIAIIATSLIGLSLVKSQGLKNFVAMQQKMANNKNPTSELVKSVSLLLAGFFLLIPGFLTDILGAIFLLPPIQKLLTRFIVPKVAITGRFYQSSSRPPENSDIIEGDFKRKNDD